MVKILAFQRIGTIQLDDTAIGPGSTTERILKRELSAQDQTGFYVWHTAGDGKVRHDHAVRDGMIFPWKNPPEGGNPGEDYNCRCWAQPLNLPQHPWLDWVRERQSERMTLVATLKSLAPLHSVNTIPTIKKPYPDAINPTWSPLDFVTPGTAGLKAVTPIVATKIAARRMAQQAAKRDIEWIRNTPIQQFQSKFKHAKIFGIKINPNKSSLEAYQKAVEQHIKSPDTVVKYGTYHKQSVIHYYNEKTGINVMRDSNGKFKSAWKLTKLQREYIKKGHLGGGKK